MKYIIYMDVFFMVNAMIDTVLLKLASFYIKPQTTFIRCIAGGVAGGILSCISLLLPYKNMLVHTLYSYIFIALCMVLVTFGKSNIKQLLKRTKVIYLTTILLGGGINLLYDYTYFGYMVQGIIGAIYANPLNLFRMIIYTSISYIFINYIIHFVKEKGLSKSCVNVELKLKGRSVMIRGLIDSGNSLTDPYYGKIVHIVEYDALQMILEGVDVHKEKYRLVPFHSLGQRNGLLEVIEFDQMQVSFIDRESYDKKESFFYDEKYPAIGLYHGYLSGEKKYEVLLHATVGDTI